MNAPVLSAPTLMLALHFAAAVACGLGAAWLARGGRGGLPARTATLAALVAMAVWAACVAASGPWTLYSGLAESVRNVALIILLHQHFDTVGQRLTLRPIVIALVGVELVQALIGVLALGYYGPAAGLLHASFIMRMMVAVGALLLVHNLYAGMGEKDRIGLRSVVFGMAGLWAFDLNFYVISFLVGQPAVEVAILRGPVVAMAALGLVLGSRPGDEPIQLRPSRVAALQTISLVVVGGYLMAMLALSELLALFEGDAARLTQIGLLVGTMVLGLIWLPSKRARAWIKVIALKHFFQHRYDYREEWLRFTQTISSQGSSESPLRARILKAVVDITSSKSALLFLIDEDGRFAEAGHDGQLLAPEEGVLLPPALVSVMEREGDIIDVDAVRSGVDRAGELAAVPEWILDDERCWAIVPLVHFDRLVGAILLSRPPDKRELDWEDFDLLKLVGRHVASYLAEQSGHEALMQSAQFDQFNRRIAFVMHDIKNLASQLNLLASNAERHAEKPEFRKDMLVTLRTASGKLQNLLDRLGGYTAGQDGAVEAVPINGILAGVEQRFKATGRLNTACDNTVIVQANREGLQQALIHLVQNAFDASEDTDIVQLVVSSDAVNAIVEVIDDGEGMEPEFLRGGLFRPFVSSKNGGFGIGAFEARELVRAMGGTLDVTSRKGLGTRFTIKLPLAGPAGLLSRLGERKDLEFTSLNEVA